ncbi:MAG: HPr family phosphocarrier protein [Clostridia bacterium]|nr:HPr family phosphocarrier protein [Clostridia bacterium]
MVTFHYTVTDPVGIHARPAGLLAKKAKEFESEISIQKGEKSALAHKLMAVMGLCIKCGDTVTVSVSGADEARAAAELERFFAEHF